jgi:daunorubicin/doxorubicin transport system ATP-binding protein
MVYMVQSGRPSREELAVETSGLTKVFGQTRALYNVDLAVPSGCVYGLLGPNGAGKTTMIRILATLLRPDAGVARVFGRDAVHDAPAVRRRVSLTGQFGSADQDLTALENLVLLGRLWGHSWRRARARAQELLETFDMADSARTPVMLLSGGMRRRLDVAASLIVTPDLLFLDEPTTGLDPHSRRQVWDIVRTIVAHGTTVLLTTQYLDEADRLADRIVVLDHGTVIAEGTSGQLKASAAGGTIQVRLTDPAQCAEAQRMMSRELGVPFHAEPGGGTLTAAVLTGDGRPGAGDGQPEVGGRVARALAELSHAGIAIAGFSLGEPSLDDVFLAITGHPAGDEAAVPEAAR